MSRKRKTPPESGSSWLNTFADLMNLIYAFCVTFSMWDEGNMKKCPITECWF